MTDESKPQHQILAEVAVSCVNRMKRQRLGMHEEEEVWTMIGAMLRAEAKTLALGQIEANRQALNSQMGAAAPLISDEHYRA